jgi:hypothetical protein
VWHNSTLPAAFFVQLRSSSGFSVCTISVRTFRTFHASLSACQANFFSGFPGAAQHANNFGAIAAATDFDL